MNSNVAGSLLDVIWTMGDFIIEMFITIVKVMIPVEGQSKTVVLNFYCGITDIFLVEKSVFVTRCPP